MVDSPVSRRPSTALPADGLDAYTLQASDLIHIFSVDGHPDLGRAYLSRWEAEHRARQEMDAGIPWSEIHVHSVPFVGSISTHRQIPIAAFCALAEYLHEDYEDYCWEVENDHGNPSDHVWTLVSQLGRGLGLSAWLDRYFPEPEPPTNPRDIDPGDQDV